MTEELKLELRLSRGDNEMSSIVLQMFCSIFYVLGENFP